MAQVTNTSSSKRRWDNLANKVTNRTLELEAGESADVDLPEGFTDPYLSTDGSASIFTPAPAPAPAPAPVFNAPKFVPPTEPTTESDDTEKE